MAGRGALLSVNALPLHLDVQLDLEQPVVVLPPRDLDGALEVVGRGNVNARGQVEGLLAPVGGTWERIEVWRGVQDMAAGLCTTQVHTCGVGACGQAYLDVCRILR